MNIDHLLLEATTSGHVTLKKNNQYFHSRHNPVEEAKAYALNFYEKYRSEKNILMLGIGIGYHLTEIFKIFEIKNESNPRIIAIDPNEQITDFIKLHNEYIIKCPSLNLLTDVDLSKYFNNFEFMKFLAMRPRTVSWHGAYQADAQWFESFLKYKASNTLIDVIENSSCFYTQSTLKSILENYNSETNIKTIMRPKNYHMPEDFLLRALNQLSGEKI